MNTDDFAVSISFNQKLASRIKISVASNATVPFTTDDLANNEKSLFFYPTDSLNSKTVRNLKNHKSAGLDGLTAENIKVSLDAIGDRLTHCQRIFINRCSPESFGSCENNSIL